MSLAACADIVERADPLRFKCVMAASADAQEKLLPLYAFNIEISRAPWVTQEPMIAEMRLQWWCDAVEEIGSDRAVRSHEVTEPLADLVRTHAIPIDLLDQMITARRWDIYKDPFENGDHFDEYIDKTSGNLMWVSMLALGARADHEEDVRNMGYGSGVASLLQAASELEGRGRNLAEGVPRSFTLNSNEILEALQEPLSGIVRAVMVALEQSPPELASDISERGMVLTGGGALLKDLDRLLMEETGIPVIIADDPLTCVARGGGKALEMIDVHGGDVFSYD